ncbi:MAG: type IX secretion system membrane protein PorP/SprF [Flavobacteriaceae bacterium]
MKFSFLFSFFSFVIFAQQDPLYTQYMYNMSVINPAYTTSDIGTLNVGLLHRNQWVGVVGAPKTSNLFLHTPINNNIEVGFSFTNDNVGDVIKENNFYGDFAYKLNLKNHKTLSFGLKAGISSLDVDFTGFELEDPSDFGFVFQNIHKTFFNFGAGVYYNTNNYYIGLSVPNLLKSQHLDKVNGQYQGIEESHWFLTGGYVFEVNKQFKLKPAFMAKAVNGAPISLDITANVLYLEKVELGVAYRIKDAVSGLINFRVSRTFRVGYAYDYTTSNLGNYSSGSHEILLLFDFNISNTSRLKSPRYF